MSFLKEHANQPSDLPTERRNFRHDFIATMLGMSPELIGFPDHLIAYNEVALPLCEEAQSMLHNVKRQWPLTVVDNVFYDSKEIRVVGVITANKPEVVVRERRGVERAVKYFYYNFGVKAEPYLVIGDRELYCELLPLPSLEPRFKGVFN